MAQSLPALGDSSSDPENGTFRQFVNLIYFEADRRIVARSGSGRPQQRLIEADVTETLVRFGRLG